jgi:hypothetical protein
MPESRTPGPLAVEMVSASDLALLTGTTTEEVIEEFARQRARGGTFRMPRAWLRHCRQLQARVGDRNLHAFLQLLQDQAVRHG